MSTVSPLFTGTGDSKSSEINDSEKDDVAKTGELVRMKSNRRRVTLLKIVKNLL